MIFFQPRHNKTKTIENNWTIAVTFHGFPSFFHNHLEYNSVNRTNYIFLMHRLDPKCIKRKTPHTKIKAIFPVEKSITNEWKKSHIVVKPIRWLHCARGLKRREGIREVILIVSFYTKKTSVVVIFLTVTRFSTTMRKKKNI